MRLSETNDIEKGRLAISSPLGRAILGAEEGDEVDLPIENSRSRKVLIETVTKVHVSTTTPVRVAEPQDNLAATA